MIGFARITLGRKPRPAIPQYIKGLWTNHKFELERLSARISKAQQDVDILPALKGGNSHVDGCCGVSTSRSVCTLTQPLKKFLPKLAKWQRRMARKKKFSMNWRKAKASITQLYAKVANIRKDFLHKVSNDISKNHAVVVVEDLQVCLAQNLAGYGNSPADLSS
jgi:hypothetical protein